jgi:hypothetical protein
MSMDGMFNIQDIDEKVTVGNGNKMVATKVGSLRRQVIQVDGSTLDIVINEVNSYQTFVLISLASTKQLRMVLILVMKVRVSPLQKDLHASLLIESSRVWMELFQESR